MKIIISNIKRITQKDVKRIQHFYNSLSGDNQKIKKIYREYPKENLVREVSFNLDCEVKDVLYILINFLAFIQHIDFEKEDKEWYTLKIGNYLLSFYEDKGGALKIFLK